MLCNKTINRLSSHVRNLRPAMMSSLAPKVQQFITENADIMKPDNIHICDGSDKENKMLLQLMTGNGMIRKLDSYDNWLNSSGKENQSLLNPSSALLNPSTYGHQTDTRLSITLPTVTFAISSWIARTDPKDVARVESKTYISTDRKEDTIPTVKSGVKGVLGNWMSPNDMDKELSKRYPNCMKGSDGGEGGPIHLLTPSIFKPTPEMTCRTMYVIPFSMGPVGSELSKIGIEVTDSPYVVASMRIMTRIGKDIMDTLSTDDFVKCVHSVGQPLTHGQKSALWPCNPAETIISHSPANNLISSFGSGYGGNSLMGKKCFALRIGSTIANKEGWLAEHMLILGITNPQGKKHYIAAAFPSACGKTNLAMLEPSLPGYKVECVGDDIAWMRFDDNGDLRAINPEAGFFGVAPGTSMATNPNAMRTIQKNTIFTNVASTGDGQYYWEGLEKESDISSGVTSWLNEKWTKDSGKPSSHPNSRFCTPADQCPIMDSDWESPRGVKIEAILFGGRRPDGVPLVFEALDWRHGVYLGASMRSESTAAAEHKGKVLMHDPFAMRPFFGYNFGSYLQHWLSMEQPNRKMPRIYHVNWFSKTKEGKFMWPGFGENCRVLDWICRRTDGQATAIKTPIGYLPEMSSQGINIDGLKDIDMKGLLNIDKDFWLKETVAIRKYFDEQLPSDLPSEIDNQLSSLKDRLGKM